jgi:glycosyltransferase involved in cell wall biosynthesis
MNNNDLVSIIMPIYNRADVVNDAIDSCFRQTYQNWELIICDDHSVDETWNVISERAKEDKRIIVCKNPKGKKGANAARNTAIRASKGRYLTFLDSDDYLLDNAIEVRVETFRNNPNVAMVYGNAYCEVGKKRNKWIYPDLDKEKINQRKYLMENLALCSQITIMFRREVMQYIGQLNEQQKGWSDDGFVVAVGMKYKIMSCRKFVSVARKSEVSMTSNKWNMYLGCKIMVNTYKKDIVKYASLGRYLIWRVRLFSLYSYAKEVDSKDVLSLTIWRFFHESSRKVIKPYFRIYCE